MMPSVELVFMQLYCAVMTICNGSEYQYVKSIEHVGAEQCGRIFILLTNHPHLCCGDLRKPHKTQYEACNADDHCRLDRDIMKKLVRYWFGFGSDSMI